MLTFVAETAPKAALSRIGLRRESDVSTIISESTTKPFVVGWFVRLFGWFVFAESATKPIIIIGRFRRLVVICKPPTESFVVGRFVRGFAGQTACVSTLALVAVVVSVSAVAGLAWVRQRDRPRFRTGCVL